MSKFDKDIQSLQFYHIFLTSIEGQLKTSMKYLFYTLLSKYFVEILSAKICEKKILHFEIKYLYQFLVHRNEIFYVMLDDVNIYMLWYFLNEKFNFIKITKTNF